MKHEDLTRQIISAAYIVYNSLGSGFLENVCENALFIELRLKGLYVEQQPNLPVFYIGLLINFGSSVEVKRKYRLYKSD
ncbi:GxxExxY protein [Dyadobacter sp. NIV53]|uniref:GxxExxY protein n=1 Tax=Dyadobacter sp. NIV53 TaxID=2861765 RepID=UPI001C8732D2|nr:GxxExxY protein [Dyadobacter sp. NIV53]